MSWTYTGNPGASTKDELRFIVGDTDSTRQLLQDAEVWFLLSQHNDSPKAAAISAVRAILSKLSRRVDQTTGKVSVKLSQAHKHYTDMLDEMQRQLGLSGVDAIAGGISISDKDGVEVDSDRVPPIFEKKMHDNDREGDLKERPSWGACDE